MRMIRIMVLAATCFSGLAPAQKVTTQYSRADNFSQFHTYKWITITGSSAPNQITAENIVNVIKCPTCPEGTRSGYG
jgi:hypothetical protein